MKTTILATISAAALVASTVTPVLAQETVPAGAYNFDPDHSTIAFEYDHMGFSTSHGLIRGVTGTINLDPANPDNSTVEASFPVSNLISVAKVLDGHLLGDDFFKSPEGDQQVTFKSTKVTVDSDGDEADVIGDLTLNGVTKQVKLDVDLNKAGVHPMTNKPAIGFDAETKIKRSEFNLGQFAPAVEDEVEINISVEAAKAD